MAGQDRKKSNQDGTMPNNVSEPNDQQNDENIIEEYDFLDSKLDELNSALDYLEQKNDDIHERLKELLQSNIDTRKQFQTQNMDTTESSSD